MIPLSHRLVIAFVAFVVVAIVVLVVQGIHPYVELGSKEHPGFRLEDNTILVPSSCDTFVVP